MSDLKDSVYLLIRQIISIWQSRRARSLLLFPLMALSLGILIALTAHWSFRQQITYSLSDLFLQVMGGQEPDPRIVVVGIDDMTVSAAGYGSLTSWDRTIYAELIEKMREAGVRVIAFDILFARKDERGDDALAATLQDASDTLLAVLQTGTQFTENTFTFQFPTPSLLNVNPYLGHTTVISNRDTVVRSVPLVLYDQNQVAYEALGLQAARLFWRLPEKVSPLIIEDQQAKLLVKNAQAAPDTWLNVPVDPDNRLIINFSRPNSYIKCTFLELTELLDIQPPNANMSGQPEKGQKSDNVVDESIEEGNKSINGCSIQSLKDKIVFIGITGVTNTDLHMTTIRHAMMHGVEIHANITASLLNRTAIQAQSLYSQRLLILLFALGLGLLGMMLRPLFLLFGVVLGGFGTIFFSIAAYANANMLIDLAGPFLTLGIVGAALLALQNATHQREHEQILVLFAQQTSPGVLKELLHAADKGTLKLGGERRTVSVVFIDMRDYTALSEKLSPEDVMKIINAYLSIIAGELMRHGGTLTHYAGDQAMAIFNAPHYQEDHALRAARAAVSSIEAVAQFNKTADAESLPLRAMFGAGVNTGVAVVGNIGTVERYNYTVIGDAVNIAARLCGAAPPGTVYLGPDTHDSGMAELTDRVRTAGPISVKGKAEPLTVYRIELTEQPKSVEEQLAMKKQIPKLTSRL